MTTANHSPHMDNILLIDVGNSNIVIGTMADGQLRHAARLVTDRGEGCHALARRLADVWAAWPEGLRQPLGGMMASVVPQLTEVVRRAVEQVMGIRPKAMGDGDVRLAMPVGVERPDRVGHDRLADAIGARARYDGPLVVVDMGTATTVNVVDAGGRFVGGMIIPGMRTAFDALCGKASQLSQVPLVHPGVLIGRNTAECMQSGLLHGYAAMVDGLVERIAAELGERPQLVLTGGLAPLIADLCHHPLAHHEHLLLEGLYHIYRDNRVGEVVE